MSTAHAHAPRVQARWQAQANAADAFLRAQKATKPATTLEGIQARIDRASRRVEAILRLLSSSDVPDRERLLAEWARLQADLVCYWADKRRALAGAELEAWR